VRVEKEALLKCCALFSWRGNAGRVRSFCPLPARLARYYNLPAHLALYPHFLHPPLFLTSSLPLRTLVMTNDREIFSALARFDCARCN